MIVGLTGGIGSGKSTVAQLFAEQGIPAVDADIVARQVVEPGTPALAAITEHFGASILLSNGELNRTELRQRIFNHNNDKQWLEALLHPLIREAMLEQLHSLQSQAPYCLLVAPLLFENGLEKLCERTVVVDVPESLQKQRALQRDGNDEATIERIMASQLSRDARKAKADYILDNSGDKEALQGWVTPLHNILYLASQWPDVS